MFKAVLFDIDGTLVDNESASRKALAKLQQEHGVLSTVEAEALWQAWAEAVGTGKSNKELVDEIYGRFGLAVSQEEAEEISRKHRLLHDSAWTLFPDAKPCLDSLGDYLLGVVSNGDPTRQRRKLIQTLSVGSFSSVVISGDHGIEKPAPMIFANCLKELDVKPEEAVYIGDSVDKDVAGAKQAGMKVILVDRGKGKQDVDADAVVTSLKETAAILARWKEERNR